MERLPKDDIATLAAIGLLAYVSADIVHHALGHGATCLVLQGQIRLLTSVFVNCTLTGIAIDLAGPIANLALGLFALLAVRVRSQSSTTRLFFVLAAAFNLFWFGLQLAFSAATRTDDWAWAMQYFHVTELVRYSLIAAGALAYVLSMRLISAAMAPFAHPRRRAATIVVIAWLTAGVIACATAAFDRNPATAILRHAAPQSLLLSLGLFFVPARAARLPATDRANAAIAKSIPWIIAAIVVATLSMVYLGPGVTIVR